jgi:hypothetical protein
MPLAYGVTGGAKKTALGDRKKYSNDFSAGLSLSLR